MNRNLQDNVVKYFNVGLANALCGCDTASALYGRGNIQVYKILDNTHDLSLLYVFKRPNSAPEEIALGKISSFATQSPCYLLVP